LRLAPDRADDVEPLLAVLVALVVRELLLAEHLELVLVPAADEVEPEPAAGEEVDGRHLLGRDDRVDHRRVDRPEDGAARRVREHPGRPRDRLERGAVEVGGAAVAAPATDREDELESRLVDEPGDGEVVLPGRLPRARRGRDREAAAAVRGEEAELQPVGVRHRAGSLHAWTA